METRNERRENLKDFRSIAALVGLLALSLHNLVLHGHEHAEASRVFAAASSDEACGQQSHPPETSVQQSLERAQACPLCNELRRGADLDFRETASLIPPSSESRNAKADSRPLASLVESRLEARGPPSAWV